MARAGGRLTFGCLAVLFAMVSTFLSISSLLAGQSGIALVWIVVAVLFILSAVVTIAMAGLESSESESRTTDS